MTTAAPLTIILVILAIFVFGVLLLTLPDLYQNRKLQKAIKESESSTPSPKEDS